MTTSSPLTARHPVDQPFAMLLAIVCVIWAAVVIIAATTGALAALYPPIIGLIVALTIVVPTVWYLSSPRFQRFMDGIGHRRILLFHTWRIPAALLFFWYGAAGLLPPVFWILAGVGDLLAGAYAAWLLTRTVTDRDVMRFHVFGFADFVVAVGTGLTHTLLLDPRMSAIAALPIALIPLYGVGISGTTHLMAFNMLRRQRLVTNEPLSA